MSERADARRARAANAPDRRERWRTRSPDTVSTGARARRGSLGSLLGPGWGQSRIRGSLFRSSLSPTATDPEHRSATQLPGRSSRGPGTPTSLLLRRFVAAGLVGAVCAPVSWAHGTWATTSTPTVGGPCNTRYDVPLMNVHGAHLYGAGVPALHDPPSAVCLSRGTAWGGRRRPAVRPRPRAGQASARAPSLSCSWSFPTRAGTASTPCSRSRWLVGPVASRRRGPSSCLYQGHSRRALRLARGAPSMAQRRLDRAGALLAHIAAVSFAPSPGTWDA